MVHDVRFSEHTANTGYIGRGTFVSLQMLVEIYTLLADTRTRKDTLYLEITHTKGHCLEIAIDMT